MPDQKSPEVNFKSARYLELEASRKKCRDCDDGLEALCNIANGNADSYLPRNPAEVPERIPGTGKIVDPWETRVTAARLDPFYSDALETAHSRLTRREPEIAEDTPPALRAFLDDVDGQGTAFDVFAQDLLFRGLREGFEGVLVDFPQVPPEYAAAGVRTAEDAAVLGLQPRWKCYTASAILEPADLATRNATSRPKRVRLSEWYTEPDGEWGTKPMEQVRVLWAGDGIPASDGAPPSPTQFARFQVYRQVKAEKKIVWEPALGPGMSGTFEPQVEIPFSIWKSTTKGEPPFLRVANLLIAWLRKASELDNSMHAVGFPIMHWAGGDAPKVDAKGRPVEIGPRRLLRSTNPQAKVELIEVTGASWEQCRQVMKEIAEAGARAAAKATDSSVTLTATGEKIRDTRATSRLAAWATTFEDFVANLLRFTAIYMGTVDVAAVSGWGGIVIDKDFSSHDVPVEVAQLVSDRVMAGRQSAELAFPVLKAAGVYPESAKFADEAAKLPDVELALAAALAAGRRAPIEPTTTDGLDSTGE